MVQVERRGKKLNPTIGFILFCLFSKSPRSGTANLFANSCNMCAFTICHKTLSPTINNEVWPH